MIENIKKVQECKDGIILIHNHSLNGRPSMQDIFTFSNENKIMLSTIVCHDGTVYIIDDVNPKVKDVYSRYLQNAILTSSSMNEAKQLATTKTYRFNETLSEKRKLISLRRL